MAPLPRQMIYPQGMPQPRAVPMHPARNYYMLCVRFCLKPARRLPTPNASSPWLEWQKQPPGSFFRRTAAQRRSKIYVQQIFASCLPAAGRAASSATAVSAAQTAGIRRYFSLWEICLAKRAVWAVCSSRTPFLFCLFYLSSQDEDGIDHDLLLLIAGIFLLIGL